MLFQTFDDKKNCVCVYRLDELHFKIPQQGLSKTWSYSGFLKDQKIEYAQLYCGGQSLLEVCPKKYLKEWEEVNSRLKAFHRSIHEVNLDLNEHCFFEMVPNRFLKDYGLIKNKICAHVFNTYKRPENYDFLLSLTKIINEIKYQKLNIDLEALRPQMHKYVTRRFVKKVNNVSPYIDYNIFGTKTGRLTTKGGFPILTLKKEHRSILRPNNDWFLELDYNAAELRVLLGLLGQEQPVEDLHEWNLKNVYKNVGTRERAKKRIFAWLYNSNSNDRFSSKIYDRDSVAKKYYKDGQVTTYFNRVLEADEHHALNYIIQSTASDLFLRQMMKINEQLKGRKSHVAFCLHDSLIIDFSEDDQFILNDLKKEFANTELGNFRVNVFAGKNYGAMKKLYIY